MKKILLSMMTVFIGIAAYAQTELKITFPMTDQTSVSAYSCEWTGKDADGETWTFKNFNNNKNGWTLIKCGWKNDVTTSEITSPVIAEAVTEYAIEIGQTSGVTSCNLEVIVDDEVAETKAIELAAGSNKVALAGTKNAIYHLVIENEKVTANGTTTITSLTVTKAASEDKATKPGLTDGCVFTTAPFDVTITNQEAGATVYYTLDGTTPTTESTSFTGESKTIQISETTTVKAMAAVSGKANSSVSSATYTFENSIANTIETAYTTAEAIALIDAGSTQLKTVKVYVKGSVSQVDKYNETYGSIQYWLDENAFEIYGGLNNNGEKFASIDDVQVGAEVIAYGLLKKYNSTYEMDLNNWLVQYTAPAKPQPSMEATYKTALEVGQSDELTWSYQGDATLTCSSSDDSVATIVWDEEDLTFIVTALQAGKATITITSPETEKYQEKTLSYTLTVTAPATPAEVPFAFDGGVADVTTDKGMTQKGIDSKDYSASPKLKFNTTGDWLVINIASEAQYLHYSIKGNGSDTAPGATGQFDVLESADGETYTTVHTYTELNTGDSKEAIAETYALKADTRFIKFIYTTKTAGNVGLGAINISNDETNGVNALTLDSTLNGKYLNGNQVVIIKNGKRYNTAGQILK